MPGELAARAECAGDGCEGAGRDCHCHADRAEHLLPTADRGFRQGVQQLTLDSLQDREVLDEQDELQILVRGVPGGPRA